MSSSNSFNICPRCGNSNSLNAKYCSRCGAQMKVPTEAVVCHKCHTRNSALANFCRNCGATLKVGAQTKICPRCGREIGAEENMCACGYSFVTLQQAEPRRADVSVTNRDRKKDKKRGKEKVQEQNYAPVQNNAAPQEQGGKKSKQKKGGRGFALFAFLFLAVFVVFALLPASARGPLVNFDKGIFQPKQQEQSSPEAYVDEATMLLDDGDGNEEGGEAQQPAEGENGGESSQEPTAGENNGENQENTGNESGNTEGSGDGATIENNIYGWDLITKMINLFKADTKEAMGQYEGGAFKYIMNEYFGPATFIVVAMFALFLLTAVFHLLVCLARIIAPKRSKRANMLYLVLAVITTILVILMFASQAAPAGNFKNFFTPVYDGLECSYGYVVAVIPVYYWFFWLYSCMAKRKTPKKEKKSKKNA